MGSVQTRLTPKSAKLKYKNVEVTFKVIGSILCKMNGLDASSRDLGDESQPAS